MYHILTSVYAALFRASTPLYLDWRVRSNMELLGNSDELKLAFIALRTEVEWFCKSPEWMALEKFGLGGTC